MRTSGQLVRDAKMLLSRRLNRSLAPPDRVSVNVTLRCNLSCVMCTTCYDAPELSTDEIKGIIDQTAAWGVEVFNPLGGEPFMRADIEEILAYAVQRGFYVTVTTNGTLITPHRAAGIAKIPSDRLHLNFSLDGDEASHDMIRGKGMFRRAMHGYQRIRDADAAAGNSRRKILANTLLTARNAHNFLEILDAQAAAGFDGVQVLNLFRQGPDVPKESHALWFFPEHQAQLVSVSEALAIRAERPGTGGYRIQNAPRELRLIPRYYAEGLEPLEAPCWAGWKELYINADGAAIMCDGELDFLAGTFGNAREMTLRQLWQSPALRERRSVVKRCETPCIQTCYLRGSSDSGAALAADAARLVTAAGLRRLSAIAPRRAAEHHPDAVLRLELSDVCPCDWEGCTTPPARWASLVSRAPEPASAANWNSLRDRRFIDFGRGFMGFEVVRDVVRDLREDGFGTLALRWRGEPLLHPEIEPILAFLLDQVAEGLADRLRIETDGRFLTPALAALAGHRANQEWIFDYDRGQGAGLRLLQEQRGPNTRVLIAASATPGLDAAALHARYPLPPAIGRMPATGDALWIRRTDHDHYAKNAEARRLLAEAGAALGVSGDLGEEDRARRCPAPSRTPTVSWDGKVVLCPRDVTLQNRLGEVTGGGQLSALWRSAEWAADRSAAATTGAPNRGLCQGCGWPWSPNL